MQIIDRRLVAGRGMPDYRSRPEGLGASRSPILPMMMPDMASRVKISQTSSERISWIAEKPDRFGTHLKDSSNFAAQGTPDCDTGIALQEDTSAVLTAEVSCRTAAPPEPADSLELSSPFGRATAAVLARCSSRASLLPPGAVRRLSRLMCSTRSCRLRAMTMHSASFARSISDPKTTVNGTLWWAPGRLVASPRRCRRQLSGSMLG